MTIESLQTLFEYLIFGTGAFALVALNFMLIYFIVTLIKMTLE